MRGIGRASKVDEIFVTLNSVAREPEGGVPVCVYLFICLFSEAQTGRPDLTNSLALPSLTLNFQKSRQGVSPCTPLGLNPGPVFERSQNGLYQRDPSP
jgi:hypothetical protein